MNRPTLAALLAGLLAICGSCRRHRTPSTAVSEIVLANGEHKDRILRGILPGEGGWRFTAPVFAFALDPPSAGKPVFLELDLDVPEELSPKLPVTLTAKVNGKEIASKTYAKPGRITFDCPVPDEALQHVPAEVEYSADRSYTDGA